ncbi:phage tail tube protein [Streptomyces buecherae]|uniref:phage tail tube protein n=1 Tax=Streptomyces buecherae TaxID=2763006 RepID=UPI00379FF6D5
MANDPNKIRFAPNGALYIAPAPVDGTTGTKPPTELGDGKAAPAGYRDFGYVDESGVTLTPSVETSPVAAWQSAVPVLYIVTGAAFSVKSTFIETNPVTTELFFGAPWEEVKTGETGTGVYRLNLSSTPEFADVSLVVDWQQKGYLWRVVISRAMVSDRGAIQLTRKEPHKYELTLEGLDFAGGLGYVLTNDPSIMPPATSPGTLSKSASA